MTTSRPICGDIRGRQWEGGETRGKGGPDDGSPSAATGRGIGPSKVDHDANLPRLVPARSQARAASCRHPKSVGHRQISFHGIETRLGPHREPAEKFAPVWITLRGSASGFFLPSEFVRSKFSSQRQIPACRSCGYAAIARAQGNRRGRQRELLDHREIRRRRRFWAFRAPRAVMQKSTTYEIAGFKKL